MKRVKFWMNCGYVNTTEYEVMEFPDDITEDEIESEVEMWFWDNFGGGFGWEEIDEEEECND